ncbi:kelch repeat-containing protein [Rubrivivax rivuli]|uniref:BIG2 domain-containing protein n=1 Tax=Rubrivivax rivuli TaxID=1862385 RepID=A0A437RHE3_9BURK|nr:kelch repeat-containing protein [Rubrivivax rivuli]RVU46144.1 hypothetical protein EOE66_09780 [Rubrivivax rivuli]
MRIWTLMTLRACFVLICGALVACGADEIRLPPQLQAIDVTPASPSIAYGQQQQFTAVGRFGDGSVVDLTNSVRWKSSVPGVAVVVDAAAGLVQSVGAGTTQISADAGSVSGSTTLQVRAPALVSLMVEPAAVYAGVGIATQIAAWGQYADGSRADLTALVSWSSPSAAVQWGPRPGQVSGLALGVTVIGASLGAVSAQAPLSIVAEAWSPAPNPAGGNSADAAVLLQDGRVLVLKGRDGDIYDPVANRWSATAPLPIDPGSGCSATLLADGRVLFVGGGLSGVEIFNPTTNTWSTAASMLTARRDHTASLLASGHVLVVGGRSFSGQTGAALATAESFDPVANLWSPAGDMSTARTLHTATRLADGRVLVVGGSSEAGAEIHDPATNTWSRTSPMHAERAQHTATLLPDGRVLVVGGVRPTWNMALRSTEQDWASPPELYDPRLDRWTLASVPAARFQHSASLLPDGRVLVAGGAAWYYFGPGLPSDLARKALSAVQVYDPATGTSTGVADLPVASAGHRAILLPGGKTLVIGGHGLETRLVFRDPGLPRVVTTEVAVPNAAFYW